MIGINYALFMLVVMISIYLSRYDECSLYTRLYIPLLFNLYSLLSPRSHTEIMVLHSTSTIEDQTNQAHTI